MYIDKNENKIAMMNIDYSIKNNEIQYVKSNEKII